MTKRQAAKKHSTKLSKKINLRSGLVRLGIPLFIVAVLVASVAGVVIYSQNNQSHAANWTYLGYNSAVGLKGYACKVLLGYDGGRSHPVYQVRLLTQRVKGGMAGKPAYSIAVGIASSSTSKTYYKVLGIQSSTWYNASGYGSLVSNTLLNLSNPLARFSIGLGTPNPVRSVSGYPYGMPLGLYSAGSVTNCY